MLIVLHRILVNIFNSSQAASWKRTSRAEVQLSIHRLSRLSLNNTRIRVIGKLPLGSECTSMHSQGAHIRTGGRNATEHYKTQTATEHTIAFVYIDKEAPPQNREVHNTYPSSHKVILPWPCLQNSTWPCLQNSTWLCLQNAALPQKAPAVDANSATSNSHQQRRPRATEPGRPERELSNFGALGDPDMEDVFVALLASILKEACPCLSSAKLEKVIRKAVQQNLLLSECKAAPVIRSGVARSLVAQWLSGSHCHFQTRHFQFHIRNMGRENTPPG